MGKIINITEPDGTNIKYDYDYAGNLVSTTDGNRNTTRYTYNSLNLLSEIIDPDGRKITFKYDRQGRMVQRIGKDGHSTYYTYNADNNITAVGKKKDRWRGTSIILTEVWLRQ